ncbi:bifunctional 2-polyprenyl-6-hydroxyphenol methylase/3-demethylubiquinol 3-O-methyltransferase UbiG [Hahella sp. SMD15-11]|uniref:Ubiquinone biosynthesis O-methyltransferase n=1 Tax=Thermohahella caldifontis TaxID=3142973 RepID=A0AB39UXG5_9GAMM
MTRTQENVDLEEIRKFEELAHRWWDPHSEFRPLHQINPLRLDYIDSRAGLRGKRVLDVGCGGGILSESMAARGADVTGIDMGEAPLAVARLHSLESGIPVNYQRTTIEALADAAPESFDVVTCMEMLEHVPDPASVVAACARVAKPGAHLFFSTLNRNPKSFLFAIVGAEYVLKLLPRGTHQWSRFIKPGELARFVRQAGLNMQDMIGMTYNPVTRTYKLGPDVDVNYMIHTRKPEAE